MYTIVSTAGLDTAFERPVDAYCLLYEHLAAAAPLGKVAWTITTPDGRNEYGDVAMGGHPDDLAGLTELAETITAGLLWAHAERRDAADGDRPE